MEQSYIYESIDKEAERLHILNKIYNVNSLAHLTKLITPASVVLEIGPGIGMLGAEIAEKLSSTLQYTGLEQDIQQIERAKKTFAQRDLVVLPDTFIHGSVTDIDNIEGLKNKKFDLIFCRWVIAHLPADRVSTTLTNLYQYLKPGGYLVCEEGDVSVACVVNKAPTFTSPVTQAFDKWYTFSFALEKVFNLNLRIGADIEKILAESTATHPITYTFQPRLSSSEEKMMFSYAIASTKKAREHILLQDPNFFHVFGDMDQLERDLIRLAEDQTVEIAYIKNYLTLVQRL
jgi:2-polyprenyl-3-methyl-5-hydroxy-6-metoxy-1,4-benzoquinol methylase